MTPAAPRFPLRRPALAFAAALLTAGAQAGSKSPAAAARPLAMGEAFGARAGDSSSVFYNPAAMAGGFGYRETSFHYGAFDVEPGARSQNRGAWSFVDASTDSLSYALFWTHASTASVRRENTVALSLSYPLYPLSAQYGWSLGATLKNLNYSTQSPASDKSGFGLDVGIYNRISQSFSWGLAVRDAVRPPLGPAGERLLPATWDLGLALQVSAGTALALDVIKTQGIDSAKVRGGVEHYFMNNRAALRFGANDTHTTYGLGFKIGNARESARVDYAFASPFHSDREDALHAVSLSVRWGAPAPGRAQAPASDLEALRAAQRPLQAAPAVPPDEVRQAFLVGTDDIIKVSVKNHPELDAEVGVDAWGEVKLPFVGRLKVSGMTIDEIEAKLGQIYANFIENPQVDVEVPQWNSRAIYILGAVRQPGKYLLRDKVITLRDAVSQAGLPTDRAALWRVFVVRPRENGKVKYIPINLHRILYRGKLEHNIELQPGDTVYLPMSILDTIATFVGRIVSPIAGAASNAARATVSP